MIWELAEKLVMELKGFIANAEHIFIAAVFSIVNALVRPPQASFSRYAVEFVLSVIVASFVGYICTEEQVSKSLTHTFVAISALLARDSLEFITGFGDYLQKKRIKIYDKLIAGLTNVIKSDRKK